MQSLVHVKSSVATLTLVLALAGQSRAQCNMSDGLDAGPPCGSGPFVMLNQKGFQQQSLGICWKDCGVDATANYSAVWSSHAVMLAGSPPAPVCAWYGQQLVLLQGSTFRWIGKFHATYSRTWSEVDNSGQPLQVWRYLVNGDMTPLSANPGPCAKPPCAVSFGNVVRFTGYIDYAQDCSIPGAPYVHAWMITHACDAIDHQAGYPRQGVFHPDRFYSFVGPAANFAVGAGGTLENGAAPLECVRRWQLPMPARCNYEERLNFATFNPNALLCMCGTGPGLWYEAFFNASGALGTTISPYLGSAPFRSYPIGMWTNPGVFPGVEEVRYNTNDLLYAECTGNPPRQEYYYGVTTVGGFQAFQVSPLLPPFPLPLTFIDQGNSMVLPAMLPTRNRPYRSDHVLNLNM